MTDPKKKKTMYIRRPAQINNILFADTEMKEQIKGFCVLADANKNNLNYYCRSCGFEDTALLMVLTRAEQYNIQSLSLD